jgi:hypothetical protein
MLPKGRQYPAQSGAEGISYLWDGRGIAGLHRDKAAYRGLFFLFLNRQRFKCRGCC